MRRACRTDANQTQMVSELEAVGYLVIDCSAVAQLIPGFPDLLLARRGELKLAEIKTEEGTLTNEQVIFNRRLEPFGIKPAILRNFDDVLKLAGGKRAA
jgi:hypothetical protein